MIAELLHDKLSNTGRLAIIGVGSVLKADDGVGMYITEALQHAFPHDAYPGLLFCPGETAPENFCGKIQRFCPDLILIIDAADIGETPGTCRMIAPETVGGPMFCSHMLPLKVMLRYLQDETGADALLLGMQPKSLAFDAPLTEEVRAAADALIEIIANEIRARFDAQPQ